MNSGEREHLESLVVDGMVIIKPNSKKERKWKGVDWIQLAQDIKKSWALVKKFKNILIA